MPEFIFVERMSALLTPFPICHPVLVGFLRVFIAQYIDNAIEKHRKWSSLSKSMINHNGEKEMNKVVRRPFNKGLFVKQFRAK